MTSSSDYNVHEVGGPSEIPRHEPLADHGNQKNRRLVERKKRRGKKARKTGAKGSISDQDQPKTDQSTPDKNDEHEIDYYA